MKIIDIGMKTIENRKLLWPKKKNFHFNIKTHITAREFSWGNYYYLKRLEIFSTSSAGTGERKSAKRERNKTD